MKFYITWLLILKWTQEIDIHVKSRDASSQILKYTAFLFRQFCTRDFMFLWFERKKKHQRNYGNKYLRKIRNLRYFMLISQNKIQINCIALNSKGSFIMNLQFWIWKAAVKWKRHWVYICTIYYCALNIHSCFLILFIRLKMTQSKNQEYDIIVIIIIIILSLL